uniref:Lipocalin n=1 Tax=Rhipicephalus zambeziensis TaxID=60191 RepID=A0A224YBJ4_9ACAR
MYQKVSTAIFVILVAHMELPERLFPALHVDSYSIRDFLNTKEYIWTYNTTKTNVIRCRYDLMLFVEGRFICFNRTMLNGRQRISVQLLGQFSRRRLGRMYVFREGHPLTIETLTYKAPDCSCGVVVVRPLIQGTTYVDLRVRNSFIRDGPRYECRREFSRITHHGRVIYSSNCSQDLRNTLV